MIFRKFVGPFHVVAVLLVGVYVLNPFIDNDAVSAIVGVGATCTALMLGIRASECQKTTYRVAQVLVGLIVGTTTISLFVPNHFDVVRPLLSALTLIGLVTMLRCTLRATQVDADKIFAAISVLMLIGWFFAFVYLSLDARLTGAFTGSERMEGDMDYGGRSGELTYFSFVTLTTLGYGDIAPTLSITRSLATIEALTGQLYLAILVARLVALNILHSQKSDAGN